MTDRIVNIAQDLFDKGFSIVPCKSYAGKEKPIPLKYGAGQVYGPTNCTGDEYFAIRMAGPDCDLVLIDIDGHHEGQDANAAINAVADALNMCPSELMMSALWQFEQARGSYHFVFRVPADSNISGTTRAWLEGHHVDIKSGANGLCNIKPGKQHMFKRLEDVPMLDMGKMRVPFPTRAPASEPDCEQRISDVSDVKGLRELERIVEDFKVSASEGQRNDALNTAALKAGKFVGSGCLSSSDATAALVDAAIAAGLPQREASRTVESGLSRGVKEPKSPALTAAEAFGGNVVEMKQPEPVVVPPPALAVVPPPSLVAMAASNPLAQYAQDVAGVIQIPENSVFIIGLGLVSSIVGSAYCADVRDNRAPVGLYVCAEQPPGTGKSGTMEYFQRPWFGALDEFNKERASQWQTVLDTCNSKKEYEMTDSDRELLKKTPRPVPLWLTNATSEAAERELVRSKGYFAMASSEQGLFNALFGTAYKQAGQDSNNDLALNGFAGEWFSSRRVSRETYTGTVHGSIASFAQYGSIAKVLTSSGCTGLAERFLWVSEPSMFGRRDHLSAKKQPNKTSYQFFCNAVRNAIGPNTDIETLNKLHLSQECVRKIAHIKQDLEPHLAYGGRFSSNAITGVVGKVDIQIVKIASVLHVYRFASAGKAVPSVINDEDFDIAANIARYMLEQYRQTLVDLEIIDGDKEVALIIERLKSFPNGEADIKEVTAKLYRAVAFKAGGRKAVEDVIYRGIESGHLRSFNKTVGGRERTVIKAA